jgi:uncharacterized membrane protein
MVGSPELTGRCAITGASLAERDLVCLEHLRPSLAQRIRAQFPALTPTASIARAEADRQRLLYVQELLREERGELTALDREVARSLAEGEILSQNIEADFDANRTFAERLSDGLATFGGSWAFLIGFAAFIAFWVGVSAARGAHSFDPYPFILLNLLLSCLAAIQAPIIMMSQKRQESKDRLRSVNDYKVNLKAELEIRHLHEKVDHLISKQWERLAEIQELQIELMQERR